MPIIRRAVIMSEDSSELQLMLAIVAWAMEDFDMRFSKEESGFSYRCKGYRERLDLGTGRSRDRI